VPIATTSADSAATVRATCAVVAPASRRMWNGHDPQRHGLAARILGLT
jgi:hypothetical protein